MTVRTAASPTRQVVRYTVELQLDVSWTLVKLRPARKKSPGRPNGNTPCSPRRRRDNGQDGKEISVCPTRTCRCPVHALKGPFKGNDHFRDQALAAWRASGGGSGDEGASKRVTG